MKVFEIIAAIAKDEPLEILRAGSVESEEQEWYVSEFSLEKIAERLQGFSPNDNIPWMRKKVEYVEKHKFELLLETPLYERNSGASLTLLLANKGEVDYVVDQINKSIIVKVPKYG